MAFIIYRKNIGGRIFDRYYQQWESAKNQLQSDLNDMLKNGCKITSHVDEMNVAKGWYDYYYTLKTNYQENAELSLVTGYFQD